MPLDPRADERYGRAPRPTRTVESLEQELGLLRKGLKQIAEGDYPAEAGSAETWAAEILADANCVKWEDHDSEASGLPDL